MGGGKAIVRREYPLSELTGRIIGCAMEVHRVLGRGFQEVIYQRALAREMWLQDIAFLQKFDMDINYKGDLIGTRRVDFLVEEKVMVEVKAVSTLENAHPAQAINYLEAYGLEVGLLLNFGAASLQHRRLMKQKDVDHHRHS